jgi:hypothetical protein
MFLRLKMMDLWVSYKKKIRRRNNFFIEERSRIRITISETYGSGDAYPDPHQNVTDPQH